MEVPAIDSWYSRFFQILNYTLMKIKTLETYFLCLIFF
jgi:hypothetical protein